MSQPAFLPSCRASLFDEAWIVMHNIAIFSRSEFPPESLGRCLSPSLPIQHSLQASLWQ